MIFLKNKKSFWSEIKNIFPSFTSDPFKTYRAKYKKIVYTTFNLIGQHIYKQHWETDFQLIELMAELMGLENFEGKVNNFVSVDIPRSKVFILLLSSMKFCTRIINKKGLKKGNSAVFYWVLGCPMANFAPILSEQHHYVQCHSCIFS